MFALIGRHLLLVDAILESSEPLRDALALEGAWCDVAADVEAAIERCHGVAFDLVVIAVPQGAGGRACAAIRRHARTPDVPLLAVVDAGAEADAVEAVLRGADGYLFKPIRIRPFLASVMALLRRSHAPGRRLDAGSSAAGSRHEDPRPLDLRIGDLDLDLDRRIATLGGHPLALSDQQFRLLHLFMANPGRVFGRQAIAERLCSSRYVSARAVDALVRRLRRQLRREGGGVQYVVTVRGSGYKLADRAGTGARQGAA